MSDNSEEKSLPASSKKLRDARQKGQVPKSQDLVTGVVILSCTLYLTATSAGLEQKTRAFLELVARVYVEPFDTVLPRVQAMAENLLLSAVVPILAVTVIVVILTNVLVMGGTVFSAEPITPQFERISPVAGFKRIFSLRSLIELLKTLFKMLTLGVAFVVVYRQGLQSLMESSGCGPACVYTSFFQLLIPLVITGIVAFLLVGGVDVLMQRWLFAREMRMSKSDQKREHKDMDGDPLIKRERHRQRGEMQASTGRRGLRHASLVIGEAGGWVVGIRYVRGETPVPVIVSRASADDSHALLDEARGLKIPHAVSADLATRIAVRNVGSPVPDSTFQAVADLLVGARLL
jgi:type III secretion protein U